MPFPFRRILSPVDFDDSSLAALDVAARIAHQNGGTILLLHVVPMVIPPTGMPLYVDIYQGQEEAAREKLREIASQRLPGIKSEQLTYMGDPAGGILRMAKRNAADLIVMATHGRRGFSRVMLGSVAEMVLRAAPCPVLCIRRGEADKHLVARWMSSNPVTTTPDEKLSTVQARMQEGNFRCAPVIEKGRLAGLVSDHDLHKYSSSLERTEVRTAMGKDPVTVAPTTPLHDAARILFERKIDGLPVLEDGQLVGVITTSDVLRAFLEED
jgi:nucleotide-binding universal stress UspA family protein